MASYPSALKTFTDPTAASNLNFPSHAQQHIDENAEITAIETELGLVPKGSSATVRARLDAIDVTTTALSSADAAIIAAYQAADTLVATSLAITSHLVVNTGTVVSGGTIPLPTGYTEAQCKWWAWIEATGITGGASDGELRNFKTTLSGRIPTFSVYRWGVNAWQDINGASSQYKDGYGRYVIIGIK